MSIADKEKWDERYRQGAYAERLRPSVLLTEHVPAIISGQQEMAATGYLRALDLACGAGRNALYLAELGYEVDALDISAEALARGAQMATRRKLSINWLEHDLDTGFPAHLGSYDLIIMMRYRDPALLSAAAGRLRAGGVIICEAHLESSEPVSGPASPQFRARTGELRGAASDLDIRLSWEGHTHDPDDRPVALARLVASRPRS